MTHTDDPTYIIGCIPLYHRDTPPPEQQNCIPTPCDECDTLMWLSEKKRAMLREKDGCLLMCFPCVARLQQQMYGDDVEFEMQQVEDILNGRTDREDRHYV